MSALRSIEEVAGDAFAALGGLTLGLAIAGASSTSCATSTPMAPNAEDAVHTPLMALSTGPSDVAARRATAQAEIGEALRALTTAGNACDDACPALHELRKGVANLCSVNDNKDDVSFCKQVKQELADAERPVKKWCGACGPHQEIDADAGDDAAY